MIAIRLPDDQLTPEQLAKRIKNRIGYQKYMAKNREKVNARHREKYRNNPERYAVYNKNWHERNPDYLKEYCHDRYLNGKHHDSNANRTNAMANAHSKIQYHKLPMAKFCELCPEDERRPATMCHHPDYNYPLIFVSVCRACHSAIHRALKKEEQAVQLQINKPMELSIS